MLALPVIDRGQAERARAVLDQDETADRGRDADQARSPVAPAPAQRAHRHAHHQEGQALAQAYREYRLYQPQPGWLRYGLQVLAAGALLAAFLVWGAQHFDWVALRAHRLQRVGLLAALLCFAALLYFAALRLAGLRLRSILKPRKGLEGA